MTCVCLNSDQGFAKMYSINDLAEACKSNMSIMKIKSVVLFLCCFFIIVCISACITITPVTDTGAEGIAADQAEKTVADQAEETSADQAEETAADQAEATVTEQERDFTPGSIPVIYLNIDGGQEEIDQMNASPEHTYRCQGTMDLFVPEGYRSPYGDDAFESIDGLEMEYIRGRGNSSWGQDKKPYKIKLDKKQDFFGMGKSKHWVLLANSFDPTLLRNSLSLWLGNQVGMPFTPQFVFADVVMNGKYLGSYYLAEQVRIEKARADLPELTEEMTEEPDIWGGYLLALHPYEKDPAEDKFITAHGVDMLHDAPSFAADGGDYQNDAQRDYIRAYVQKAEDAVFSGDFEEADALLDLESAADYWWMQEICQNLDAYRTSSTYLYKKQYEDDGTEGKLYFGPVWDFDYAWGNVLAGVADPAGFQHAQMEWTKELFCMPNFVKLVKERWPLFDKAMAEMTEDGGIIDQYSAALRDSWIQDRLLTADPADADAASSEFDENVRLLKAFAEDRRTWISEHLDELDHLFSTVTVKTGEETQVIRYYTNRILQPKFSLDVPEIEGQYFTGWYLENGEAAPEDLMVDGDLILEAHFIPLEDVTWIEDVIFDETEVWLTTEDSTYQSGYTLVPEDAVDQHLEWSVSDEEIAFVTEDGTVYISGAGDVTLTVLLHSGKTVSCLIHISEASENP